MTGQQLTYSSENLLNNLGERVKPTIDQAQTQCFPEIDWTLTPARQAFKARILEEYNNDWPMLRLGRRPTEVK